MNAPFAMLVRLLGSEAAAKAVQPAKAASPIVVTLEGMLTPVRPVPLNASFAMLVKPVGRVIELRELQPSKALFPIALILVGRLIDAKLLQPAKVLALISVTPLGIVIEDKPAQPENAPLPIVATPEGMVMELKSPQPEKALLPMLVTLLGITVFLQPEIRLLLAVSIIALQPSRESYFALFASTTILFRLLQPANAPLPIEVIVLGMLTAVRLVQFAKASSAMAVTS